MAEPVRPRRVSLGEARTAADDCRRYLPIKLTFDTRSVVLDMKIAEDWEPRIKDQWLDNQAAVRAGLLGELGAADGEAKIENYRAMGPAPWSVVFEHSRLLAQVRSSFAHGDFYPALVGACALGERILAQLILVLREDYANHSSTTRRVRRGGPFSDWGASIEVLHGWGVLSDALAETYTQLESQRHTAVHFDSTVTADEREPALLALGQLQGIVEGVFSPSGGPPRFIAGIPGFSFLSRGAEQTPIVRRVFLPNSALLSPAHIMSPSEPTEPSEWTIVDDADYDPTPLTDEEFARALPSGHAAMEDHAVKPV
ncbi:MAG: hypothetical protein QOI71_3961 [Gaiellales bacterium]|jgi:hypothetical protein|nr:hypothetical protein [Gaiellales bacterium]